MRLLFLLALSPCVLFAQSSRLALEENEPLLSKSLNTVPLVELRAIYHDMHTRIPAPTFSPNSPQSATFIVEYNGFSAPAQAAFQFAVDIWSQLVVSSVPIRVKAYWVPLGPGVLGSAGAHGFYANFPGAPQSGTFYPVSLAEKLSGGAINHPDSSDINANFSSVFSNWYFGTDGNPGSGQFDFVSVVLHELGHGLGFSGSMTVSSGQGSWGFGSGLPFIYDRFAENGSGQSLLNTSLFPNPSVALGNQLQGGNLFFNGPEAVAANGGVVPLYAPNPWEGGSSYSHFNEASYPAGNPNSLMTPAIGTAEAIHNPGPVCLGLFRDNGWTTGSTGGSSIKFEEQFTSTTIPAGWRVVDRDGSGSALSYVAGLSSTPPVVPQAGTRFWHSSFNNANGAGLIDELLISPRVQSIVTGDSLYFYAGAIGGSFDDSLRVFISTTDSAVSSFTDQIGYFRVDGPTGSWNLYGFDLSPFAGSDIFLAVNYFIVDGGPSGTHSDNVWIDHFLITTDATVGVASPIAHVPAGFELKQNYPNPFNPSTQISFGLHKDGFTTLRVYDILGREVKTLVSEELTAGTHTISFDASTFAGGVYFYSLQQAGLTQTRKMLLVK